MSKKITSKLTRKKIFGMFNKEATGNPNVNLLREQT